jgi:hypothetical protein
VPPFNHRPLDALCDACADSWFAQLRGVAASRYQWALDVAARVPRARPWPSDSPRSRVIARRRVADLARDPRLRERLAAEAERAAAECWDAS